MIEGGAINSNVDDAATVENTASLRQSFYRIFSELLGSEVNISVLPEAGYRNAARIFSKSSGDNLCLFVDLDDKKQNIANWFDKLEKTENNPIIIPTDSKEKVFFMVQEMEAWILKQPEAIEQWGMKNRYQRAHSEELVASHNSINGKNIEDITKPSEKLKTIIQYFFRKETDYSKKIKYGKLKTAPELLDCLDVIKLKNNDFEIERFYNYAMNKTHKQ